MSELKLPPYPLAMGVLTLPNEFNNATIGGIIKQALATADSMIENGASIIEISCDINLEPKLSPQQEIDLFSPIVEAISAHTAIPICINTSNPQVMEQTVKVGAKIIFDPSALTKLGAVAMAAKLQVPVVLMHRQNDPVTSQLVGKNSDFINDVYNYLQLRIKTCLEAGIPKQKIWLDLGFGHGKNLQQNLNLLRSIHLFKKLEQPILVGIYQASMVGQLLDEDHDERIYGDLATIIFALGKGADIVRTNDVRSTVDVIKVLKAIMSF